MNSPEKKTFKKGRGGEGEASTSAHVTWYDYKQAHGGGREGW